MINIYPQIITSLGLEFNERFRLRNPKTGDTGPEEWFFSASGLHCLSRPDEKCYRTFADIIYGYLEVVPQKFIPAPGETYHSFECEDADPAHAMFFQKPWKGTLEDQMRLTLNIVFRSEAAARHHCKKALETIFAGTETP